MDELVKLLQKMLKLNEDVITEEFKTKLSTILEAKINEKVEEKKKEFQEEIEKTKQDELELYKEELVDSLDEYLSLSAEEYAKDNKKNFANAKMVREAKQIREQFQEFVKNFGFQLSEEKLEQDDKYKELEEKYNKAVNEKLESEKLIKKMQKSKKIEEKGSELKTESEKEKFANLAGSLLFETEEEFDKKLTSLAEVVKGEKEDENKDGKKVPLTEKEKVDGVQPPQPVVKHTDAMQNYMHTLKDLGETKSM